MYGTFSKCLQQQVVKVLYGSAHVESYISNLKGELLQFDVTCLFLTLAKGWCDRLDMFMFNYDLKILSSLKHKVVKHLSGKPV